MGLEVNLPRRRDDEIQAICDATPRAMIKTGTYVGNNLDNRDIDIGIDLAAKSNVYVIIRAPVSTDTVQRIEYGQGDNSTLMYGGGLLSDLIQMFTSTGFQIGSHVNVNQSDTTYWYIVFWEEP